MRLLDTELKSLVEISPNEVESTEYAILSHRWGQEEVLYDIRNGTATSKRGYKKIELSCSQAKEHGFKLLWIDSCCIDKTSSAELSEAINSMYVWYQKAQICYAYLEDILSPGHEPIPADSLVQSEWFDRGWTLQELLAPECVQFFSKEWNYLGNKSDLSISIANSTGIPEEILIGEVPVEAASVAQRMSWAADRKTTRPEDISYCLMGIFSVNMPMLYGEGERAFIRLQEEIMKHSDDHSLFIWRNRDEPEGTHGLLAKSPAHFLDSDKIMSHPYEQQHKSYSMSNKGISIDLPLSKIEGNIYIAALDCPVPPDYDATSFVGIYLEKLSTTDNQYIRTKIGSVTKLHEKGEVENIVVRQNKILPIAMRMFPHHRIQLNKGPSRNSGYKLIGSLPFSESDQLVSLAPSYPYKDPWIPRSARYVFDFPKVRGELACALVFRSESERTVVILLGSASVARPGFDALIYKGHVDNLLRLNTCKTFQGLFEPKAFNSSLIVQDQQIIVKTHIQINKSIKYFLINISIKTVRIGTASGGLSLSNHVMERVVTAEQIGVDDNSFDKALGSVS